MISTAIFRVPANAVRAITRIAIWASRAARLSRLSNEETFQKAGTRATLHCVLVRRTEASLAARVPERAPAASLCGIVAKNHCSAG